MLDLSKIEAGQLVLALDDYSLKDVVHGVYGAVETLAASKNLAFKVEMPPNLPTGRGDERRLTQVLLNLVGNAIKFTDQGEITIKASAADGAYNLAVQRHRAGHLRGRPGRSCSRNSSRPTIRSPRPRAAPAWASRFPSESSRCTAAESG